MTWSSTLGVDESFRQRLNSLIMIVPESAGFDRARVAEACTRARIRRIRSDSLAGRPLLTTSDVPEHAY